MSEKLLQNIEYKQNIGNFFNKWVADLRFGSQNDIFTSFHSVNVHLLRFTILFAEFRTKFTQIYYLWTYSQRPDETFFFQFYFFSSYSFKAPIKGLLKPSKISLKFWKLEKASCGREENMFKSSTFKFEPKRCKTQRKKKE